MLFILDKTRIDIELQQVKVHINTLPYKQAK